MKGERKNKLTQHAGYGVFAGGIIGLLFSLIIQASLNFLILVTGFFMIIGFLIISFMQFLKFNRERMTRIGRPKNFDWTAEINLKKLQINYEKSLSMLQFAGILTGALFISMIIIIRDYPHWSLSHQLFYSLSIILFIGFLHLSFRWWAIIRASAHYLQLHKRKE
jgi:hypothetical protein